MKAVKYPPFLEFAYVQVQGDRLVSKQRNEQVTQENGKFCKEN